jgi:Tfp pilus assembly protein PilF
MIEAGRILVAALFALAFTLTLTRPVAAQSAGTGVTHEIRGRLMIHNDPAGNVRVRLIREDQRRPIAETFSRSYGELEFKYVPEGDYFVETIETDKLEATTTLVRIQPIPRERSITVPVVIDIPVKAAPPTPRPGVIGADVDLEVPKNALKHYRAGMKAMDEGQNDRALAEFQEAIEIYPQYYAARLEAGRELRIRKRYQEAKEILRPLREIAPRRAESHIDYGIVLLELGSREDAITELRTALQQEETNWATHLYLGWALLEEQSDEAERHFKRAIEIDEQKAARAHLALARIANGRGMLQLAIEHLDAYLTLAPDAPDAGAARKLAEHLRQGNRD